MRYNRLGESDLSVSEICLGTMTWGEQNSEAEAHEQLDFAVSRGVNFIDAAEMYPVPPKGETQGRTEAYLGSWLKKNGGQRDKLIVASKITAPGRGFGWVRGGPTGIDRKSIEDALNGSLRRLQTDYIDLYQIHWPDRYLPLFGQLFYDPKLERSTVPIEEQLDAVAGFVKAGKIRYLGLSNETCWGTLEFIRQSRDKSLPRIASIQNAYNLLNRTFETAGLSEVTRRENLPLLAYSPLGFGHLTGKYLNGAKPEGARLTKFPPFGQRYDKPNVMAATGEYVKLAKELGVSSATLAIAFVRSKWFTGSTIVGATSVNQLAKNIEALGMPFDDQVSAAIDAIHLLYPNPSV
jgi:aryl-alcohol dehydrogenase-like predicted oxidoreductase